MSLIFSSNAFAQKREDENMRAFTTSCIYGVLAGTLVGAATLAFTSKPGDNLNNVARGASFGLYSGILLGIYVSYIVPSQDAGVEQGPGVDPTNPEGEQPSPDEGSLRHHRGDLARVQILKSIGPMFPTQDNPGWGVQSQLLEIHF